MIYKCNFAASKNVYTIDFNNTMRKKNFLKLLSVIASMTLFLPSCKQEENKTDISEPVVEITSKDL